MFTGIFTHSQCNYDGYWHERPYGNTGAWSDFRIVRLQIKFKFCSMTFDGWMYIMSWSLKIRHLCIICHTERVNSQDSPLALTHAKYCSDHTCSIPSSGTNSASKWNGHFSQAFLAKRCVFLLEANQINMNMHVYVHAMSSVAYEQWKCPRGHASLIGCTSLLTFSDTRIHNNSASQHTLLKVHYLTVR